MCIYNISIYIVIYSMSILEKKSSLPPRFYEASMVGIMFNKLNMGSDLRRGYVHRLVHLTKN